MNIALTGFPGCGRSTLFRALAGCSDADTGKPLTVMVPDPRLDFLDEVHSPERKVHATVVFTDVPSPAFAPRNLSAMRSSAVLCLVLENYALGELSRQFSDAESELLLEDMSLLEKRLARLRKEGSGSSREAQLIDRLHAHMEPGTPLRTMRLDDSEKELLQPYALLTRKPMVVVSNRMGDPVTPEETVLGEVEEHGCSLLRIDAGFELELTQLAEDDRPEFLASMGYSSSGLERLVREAYHALDLIVFFTMGPDEVRAWPVRRGATAVEAAGVIHSDLARGFIRAQTITFDRYRERPDTAALREHGELRVEGRDYVVQDGDILEIRFSV